MAGEKLSLKDYLLNQGVPVPLIQRLADFRKTHGDSEVADRVRPPKVMFVDAFRDESGKVVSKGILRRAMAALSGGLNILLAGDKGGGKNVLADTLAFLFKRPLYEVSMHVHADQEALIGKDTFKAVPVEREVITGVGKDGNPLKGVVIERQGEVQFMLAPFAECLRVGGFGVLDEINMARPEAIAVLNSILDDRRRIDIPGFGLLNLHPATRVIATMNHGYAGTADLNEALSDRFVVIEVPPMTVDEIGVFLQNRFPGLHLDLAAQTAALFHDMLGKVPDIEPRAVTFRGLLQALQMIRAGIQPHEALATCVVGRTFDRYEKEVLKKLIESRIPTHWTADWAYREAGEL